MWVDHYWLSSEVYMVIDIVEELLDLGMGPKPESLRWTSTCKYEDGATL